MEKRAYGRGGRKTRGFAVLALAKPNFAAIADSFPPAPAAESIFFDPDADSAKAHGNMPP